MPQGMEPRLESGTIQDSRKFAAENAWRFFLCGPNSIRRSLRGFEAMIKHARNTDCDGFPVKDIGVCEASE
jgi:hypothetical protein